jgi:hypothetical protein
MSQNGLGIVRLKDVEFVDRMNVDNWPVRIGLYYTDPVHNVMVRMIDYASRAIEPRHTHPGRHGTTVLRGRVLAEGLTLGPLDVILGPSFEPHGPFEYPDGCNLISCFQGNDFHSEVEQLSAEQKYRLVQNKDIPWQKRGAGEVKVLIDHGLEDMLIEAYRYPPGAKVTPTFLAAVVMEGAPEVNGERLGKWDLFHPVGETPGTATFPDGGMILTVSMR